MLTFDLFVLTLIIYEVTFSMLSVVKIQPISFKRNTMVKLDVSGAYQFKESTIKIYFLYKNLNNQDFLFSLVSLKCNI